MRYRLILAVLLCCGGLAHAESAVSGFAPAQLRLAESLLQRAGQALAQREYELARQLAAQAALDARLAYGMSESQFLRRDARQVHEESARLRWLTVQQGVRSLR